MGTEALIMHLLAIILALVYGGIGALAYLTRGIRQNSLVGFRNKYTMGDEVVWCVTNERCGRAILKYGLACALAFLGALLRPTPAVILVIAVASMVPLVWLCVYYQRESRRHYLARHPEGPCAGESP